MPASARALLAVFALAAAATTALVGATGNLNLVEVRAPSGTFIVDSLGNGRVVLSTEAQRAAAAGAVLCVQSDQVEIRDAFWRLVGWVDAGAAMTNLTGAQRPPHTPVYVVRVP